MGTRDKTPESRERKPTQPGRESPRQSTGTRDTTIKSARSQPKTPVAINKGIYLSALIYIEGEQAPADNFTAAATTALKERLGQAFGPGPDGLSFSLKKVEEKTDVEQDDDHGNKVEKFQF